MGYLVWPMSVLAVAMRGLRDPLFYSPNRTTGASGSVRRAASSLAAPPGKSTTAAKAALPQPAHAGERTLSGTVQGGIPCDVGPHSSDAFLHNIRLGSRLTHTCTHPHTHTHTLCSTVTAWLVARGAATCGCFLPVVTVMPRLAPMCTGGLQGHCDTPPRCAADRFCSSKVRCARPPLPVRVACRRAHVQLTSRPGIHAACITPPQVHTPSDAKRHV